MVWKRFDFRFCWFVQVMDGGSAPEGRPDGPIAQRLLEQKLGCRRQKEILTCNLVHSLKQPFSAMLFVHLSFCNVDG